MEFPTYFPKRGQETWPSTTLALGPSKKRISNLGMNNRKFQPIRILPLYFHSEENISEVEEDKSDSGISNSYDNECKLHSEVMCDSPEYLLSNPSEELNQSEASLDGKVLRDFYNGNDFTDKSYSLVDNSKTVNDIENGFADYENSQNNESESRTISNSAKYYPVIKHDDVSLSGKLQTNNFSDSLSDESYGGHILNKTFTFQRRSLAAPYRTAHMKSNKENIYYNPDISGIEPLNEDHDEKHNDRLNKTYTVTSFRNNSTRVLQNITNLERPPRIHPSSRYFADDVKSILNTENSFSYTKKDQHIQVSTETVNEEVQTNRTDTADKYVQSLQVETFDKSVSVSLSQDTFGTEMLAVNGKNYVVLSKIGEGGSSVVYQVFDPRNGSLLAVKCVLLPKHDKASAMSYLNEIEMLKRLQDSDSVIHLYDYEHCLETKTLFVVMERGDTDLSKLIRSIFKSKKKISDPMIVYYWTEILKAVKCIHDAGIIHSDLKPSNFVLVSGRLKLIDFGIAMSVQGDMTSVFKDTATGTFNYMSPESVQDTCNGKDKSQYKVGYRSDVWSLGCILYSLVYGRTPFQHIHSPWAKIAAIMNPNTQIVYPTTNPCSQVIMDTMKRCLTFDPKRRPTVTELLQVPYIS